MTKDKDVYITSDVGQHQMWAAQYFRFAEPRRWINSGGLGTMGVGLPYAMGIKLAKPDADVFCITGEGSIQMCIQELSTCQQYKTPVKIISLNNRYLGMVRQWQQLDYNGRYSHSYMDALPDFVKLAEAYGHVGIRVTRPEDVDAALREAIALKDRTVFLDIQTDQTGERLAHGQDGQGHQRDAAGFRGPLTDGGESRTTGRGLPPRPERAASTRRPDPHRNISFTDPTSFTLRGSPAVTAAGMGLAAKETNMKHIIAVLLENEPGALSRVVALFSARGYNIESLTVATTEDPSLSRMTIVTTGSDEVIEQITKHLNRLIDVVKVVDLTEGQFTERELMLIKVRAVGKEREEMKRMADIFRGHIVDVTEKSYTIELTGDTSKLDAFIVAIDRTAILETVRTGTSGIGRGERILRA